MCDTAAPTSGALRSLGLALQDELRKHLCSQDPCLTILFPCIVFDVTVSQLKELSIPGHSVLYRYRIDVDLATMLRAREHVFPEQSSWFVHCRLDSSPQFGKDYFMTECDVVRPESVQTWADLHNEGVLVTRLLVGQSLGARASGVIVKTQKLLHQLSLETCPEC